MTPRTPLVDRRGYIVAIDGPDELVSAQLRLLPASPHIAILPRLDRYLKSTKLPAPGNERELIRQYCAAALARHAEALEFLHRSASRGNRPLVFLHGGTMSAYVACLETIMEHDEECSVEEAHALFMRRASAEVAALVPALTDALASGKLEESGQHGDSAPSKGNTKGAYVDSGKDTFEDRIIRAMRAAEALDKETEFLQPASVDQDLTVKLVDIRSRSARSSTSSTKSESRESSAPQRPPSPPEDENTPQEAVSPPNFSRKPPLQIRIPSPRATPIDMAGPDSLGHMRMPSLTPTQLSPIEEVPTAVSTTPSIQQLPRATGMNSEDSIPPTTDEHTGDSPLPRLEDYVVYLAPRSSSSELHEFVFGRLKEAAASAATLPRSDTPEEEDSKQEASPSTIKERPESSASMIEEGDMQNNTKWKRRAIIHGLPTPNHSPNPSETVPPEAAASAAASTMHRISVDEEDTATAVQNLLRSLLAARLPSQDLPFQATDVTAKAEEDPEIWGVLNRENLFVGPDGESRVDLILTVGAERGVKKERLADLVSQLEKLGSRAGSISRSGRVDIRYLIANAMQAFTAQPLTMQTQSNPFADRALLAALIVPHIETYLSTHPDVRLLLIEYPPEHLQTVLALQTVVGTELVKVVNIINSDETRSQATLSPATSFLRTDDGPSSPDVHQAPALSSTFSGPCSFSQGRYTLSSSATSLETAAFVAAIRESLISISDDYIPERPLYKQSSQSFTPKKGKGHNSQPPQQQPSSNEDGGDPSRISSPLPKRARSKDLSRVSVSTLVITPPSSPTESEVSFFEQPSHHQEQHQHQQQHYHPLPPPPPHHHNLNNSNSNSNSNNNNNNNHHINPRNIPPRSSSTTAATTNQGATPHYHVPNPDYSNPPCTQLHPYWEQVYYIPNQQPPPKPHITAAMSSPASFSRSQQQQQQQQQQQLSTMRSRCTCQASSSSFDQYTEYVGSDCYLNDEGIGLDDDDDDGGDGLGDLDEFDDLDDLEDLDPEFVDELVFEDDESLMMDYYRHGLNSVRLGGSGGRGGGNGVGGSRGAGVVKDVDGRKRPGYVVRRRRRRQLMLLQQKRRGGRLGRGDLGGGGAMMMMDGEEEGPSRKALRLLGLE